MSAADTLRRFRDAGFTITTDGVKLFVSPRGHLTNDDRDELRYFKPDILAILAREAGGDPDDDRVRCVDCRHYSAAAHRCANYRSALLMSPEVGRDLAELRQHCPGFSSRQGCPDDQDTPEACPGQENAATVQESALPGTVEAGQDGPQECEATRFDGGILRQTHSSAQDSTEHERCIRQSICQEGGSDA